MNFFEKVQIFSENIFRRLNFYDGIHEILVVYIDEIFVHEFFDDCIPEVERGFMFLAMADARRPIPKKSWDNLFIPMSPNERLQRWCESVGLECHYNQEKMIFAIERKK